MSLIKRLKWIMLAMSLGGMLLNSLPTAYADASRVSSNALIGELSVETTDMDATTTAEPSIAIDDRQDSYYEVSDETDEYGNGILYYSETSYFPLYAMIKAKNIYLYGIGNGNDYYSGMILFKDGQGTCFQWPNLTYYSLMPQLSYFDYDGDGEKEIAVIIYSNKGTGVKETELHILKPEQDEWGRLYYEEHSLKTEDIAEWFDEKFITKRSEDNREIIISFAGHDYHVDTKAGIYSDYGKEAWCDLLRAGYGSSNEFYFTQTQEIKIAVEIGFEFEDWPIEANYFGEVTAKVNFDGEKFSLSDYELIMDE